MPVISREATPPPEGFIHSDDVVTLTETIALNQETLGTRYNELLEWAEANRLRLFPQASTPIRYNDWSEVHVWTSFRVEHHRLRATRDNVRLFSAFSCPYCPRQIAVGQMFCSECEMFLLCAGCRIGGIVLQTHTELSATSDSVGTIHAYCANCSHVCERGGCSNRVFPNGPGDFCVSCVPRAPCYHCERMSPDTELREVQESETPSLPSATHQLCNTCIRQRVCSQCDAYVRGGLRDGICGNCRDRAVIEQELPLQAWPEEDMPVSGSMLIPSSPERPVRTISIETEFDGSGPTVARSLFRHGLIEGPEIGRYSSRGESEGRTPAMLKSDGTVSGGELVTYLINPDDENHAAALLRVTEVMRGMRELGHARFSSNAGGHVHMDLHGYGLKDCWNMYTIFRFLETPLYYLAGAGGHNETDGLHRSLFGNGYGQPPRAGPFGTLQEFSMRGFQGGDRSGIHFGNYAYASLSCRCGSTETAKHEDCSCDLGKATVEWRLWNAEITPRILHGWIALMQSIAAFAQDNENLQESDYPYFPWEQRRFNRLGSSVVATMKERLEWMHTTLPLTMHERDSIVACARRSELSGLGDEFLNSLTNAVSKSDQTGQTKKRPPKRPSASRSTSFALVTAENLIEVPLEVAQAFDNGYYDDDSDYDEDGGY